MLVKDLMKIHPVTVFPDTLLADAARIMLDLQVNGLPVIDHAGNLAGMITQGDLLRRPELGTAGKPASWLIAILMPARLAKDYAHTHTRHVREAMTENVVTVAATLDLEAAVTLMIKNHFKCLPVVDGPKLVGVISRSDLLGALIEELSKTGQVSLGPDAIKAHILATLASESWASKSGIHVAVQGDAVCLTGTLFHEEERKALRVIAENTPGVKSVEDRMACVDPAGGLAFPAG